MRRLYQISDSSLSTTIGDAGMTEQVMENGISNVHKDAGSIISSAVKWSGAAGAIPLPYVDLAALAAVQYSMVRDLASLYGYNPDKKLVRNIVATSFGCLVPSVAGASLVGSSLKFVPGGGTILGSAGVAAFSAAATYAIGKVFVRHFERGGNPQDFSAENIQDELKQEFANAGERAASRSGDQSAKK
jgi:uncharacterized protein (DUF697 family)